MYDTFDWGGDADKNKIKEGIKMCKSRLVPETNETFERYKFFKRDQEQGETTNSYITAVMKISDACNFGALRDSHIRDRLVRHKLFGKKDLTLAKCLEILRTSQVTSHRAQEISADESVT